MQKIKVIGILFILYLNSCATNQHNNVNQQNQRFQKVIEKIYTENTDSIGIMIHIESPDKNISFSGAVGYSSKPQNHKIEPSQPALIASNVKTYTSVAILRLIEQNKITLFQPIASLVSNKSNTLLVNDGYDTNTITIAHLLSHTSGIADYIDKAYLELVQKNQKHRWTRDEQIALSVKIGSPLGQAGDTFSYADVNYLLLTEIIEGITNKPFNKAIADLIDYKKHQLNSTWFMSLDEIPQGVKPLVHQYTGKYGLDSYEVDPSFDLYGAGGIAATTLDLARFMQLLFTGQIINDAKTFELIHTEIHTKDERFPNYHLGLMSSKLQGLQSYGHGGFWATVVQYLPEINTSIAVYIMEKDKGGLRKNVLEGLVDELKGIYGI